MGLKFTTPGSVTIASTSDNFKAITLKSGVPQIIILKGG